MALKTFNVESEVYDKFSEFCKEQGISMSRQVNLFMKYFVADEKEMKEEYIEKLDKIRRGKFLKIKSFAERYGLNEDEI